MVAKAALAILREAREGNLSAQVAAGKLYLEGGGGIRRDSRAAFYWLRTAAAHGDVEAQRLIGSSVPESSVTQPEAVAHCYELASRDGSANADLALADWLVSQRIPEGDQARAFDLLHRAAQAGDRRAQLRLAVLLKSGAFGEGREAEALHWFREASRCGSRAATLALAEWHWEHCDPAGRAWIEKAAHSADPEHFYRHAALLLGEGRTQRAAGLLEKAAKAGRPAAQLYYGLLHSAKAGRAASGVPHSLKKATYWLEKASRGGNAQASFELYRLFRRREFSLKNTVVAAQHLETAAEQGHPHAQFLMGLARLRDAATPGADLAAARWFVRASRAQHAEAAAFIRLLYRRAESVFPAAGMEPGRLVRLMARSRIALATRLELAVTFGLDAQEMLLFDPETADHGDCVLIDIRRFMPRSRRRILAVETEAERTLLERARRLLDARQPHPTDVRGHYLHRKADFERALASLGAQVPNAGVA